MSGNHSVVADQASESFPAYAPRIQDAYIDGYDPVSYEAPHSSLQRSSTYIGMGLILASLAGIGTLIYGVGLILWPAGVSNGDGQLMTIIGAVLTAVFIIAGWLFIANGRKGYKAYRAETGRRN